MSEAEFRLTESFNIDDGQLDGMTPQECFVLGYELAKLAAQAENDKSGFCCFVHADNKERIYAAMSKRGRECTLAWAANDRSETWMNLQVAPADE